MKSLRDAAVALIREQVKEKYESQRRQFDSLTSDVSSESKSTAGDKHETGRAMIQIEQEQVAKQIAETEQQMNLLERVLNVKAAAMISNGSLVKTNRGYFFLLPVAGKILVDGKSIFVISAQSPLGAKFIGMKIGDTLTVNGIQYAVEDFCND